MFGRDRGDRGALVALAIVVVGAVIAAWLGNPANEIVENYTQSNSGGNSGQNNQDGGEAVYFGVLRLRDTLAQWIAAMAAIASAAISVWAVGLVRESLKVTRDAVNEAKNANDIAREIGQWQTRAYLSVEKIECIIESGMLVFWIGIQNNGQTPARRVRMKGELAIDTGATYKNMRGEKTDEAPFSKHKSTIDGGGDFISVGKNIDAAAFWVHTDMKASHFDRLLEGKGLSSCMFRLTWADVFGKDQSVVFSASPSELANVEWDNSTPFMKRRVTWSDFRIMHHADR